MTEFLNVQHLEDGVAELTLNRAPVNALSAAFLMEFAETLDALGTDASVRSILMRSDFKVFSAGLDLKEAQEFDLSQQNEIVEGLNVGFLALFACPKPTVVAVNGAAIAGGLFFVLASDIRVASENAQFGLAEVRVGADFPVGPLEIARGTLGPNTLRRLMLTGQPIGAKAAQEAGIVDTVCTRDELADKALAEARVMAALPPIAYASIKQQIRCDVIAKIEAAMDAGANSPEDGWFNSETKAAMRAMIG